MRIKLVQTCAACPEQYDAYLDDEQIGYIRIRYGGITAEHCGVQCYENNTIGDGCLDETERVRELNACCKAILASHRTAKPEPIYDMEVS